MVLVLDDIIKANSNLKADNLELFPGYLLEIL
jgi:hypothetical protein